MASVVARGGTSKPTRSTTAKHDATVATKQLTNTAPRTDSTTVDSDSDVVIVTRQDALWEAVGYVPAGKSKLTAQEAACIAHVKVSVAVEIVHASRSEFIHIAAVAVACALLHIVAM